MLRSMFFLRARRYSDFKWKESLVFFKRGQRQNFKKVGPKPVSIAQPIASKYKTPGSYSGDYFYGPYYGVTGSYYGRYGHGLGYPYGPWYPTNYSANHSMLPDSSPGYINEDYSSADYISENYSSQSYSNDFSSLDSFGMDD